MWDVTHVGQLAIIVRYVNSDGQATKRFVKFQAIYSHTTENLTSTVIKTIKQSGLNIENICQSYDNANNIDEKYMGLQAWIKELASCAEFLPCAVYGVHDVENFNNVIKYFNIIQSLYNSFSFSTHRWDWLNKK